MAEHAASLLDVIILLGLLYNLPNRMDVISGAVAFSKPNLLWWLELVKSSGETIRDNSSKHLIHVNQDRDMSVAEEDDVSNSIREERQRSQKLMLWELLYEFSRNTTIHGLRYITEQGLSIIEKVFWFLTVMTSVLLCFYYIYNVYDKWVSTPVIVTISDELVPVNNIPFPSITICHPNKCRASKYNFTYYQTKIENLFDERYKSEEDPFNWTSPPDWIIKHADLSTVCQNDIGYDYFLERVVNNQPRNEVLVRHLEEVAEPLNPMIVRFNWRNKQWANTYKYFTKVLTQEGVCYNFNSLAASEILKLDKVQRAYNYSETSDKSHGWNSYYGYLNGDRNAYPRRGRIQGSFPDLDIILRRFTYEKDKLCNTLSNGFKIFFHHPADLPTSSLYYKVALDNQMTSISIKSSILNTSSKLIEKPPEVRKCYFGGEKNLKYFNMYTHKNCMLECLSNYTFWKCGCVGFYLPHNDSNHICNIVHTKCMQEAADDLAELETSKHDTKRNFPEKCNCLPACYTVDYDAEVVNTDFDFQTFVYNFWGGTYRDEIKFSRVTVFFQQSEFVSMRRSELFGRTDFIANCGGLLGLFLGFSFLSVVEIIYFGTLRLWCTLKRESKEQKEKQKNITVNLDTKY